MDRKLVSRIVTSAVKLLKTAQQLEGHKNPRVEP
jgi:hypothetical protein